MRFRPPGRRLALVLGLAMAAAPLLATRSAAAGLAVGIAAVAVVVATRPGLLGPGGAAVLAMPAAAVGVLAQTPYAAAAALVQGVLTYLYLEAGEASRADAARVSATVTGGACLSGVVLLAAAVRAGLPSWTTLLGLAAVLAAVLVGAPRWLSR